MAREDTYGYLDIGTNKYGWSVVFPGEGPWYGGRPGDPAIIVHHMYGIKLPPPIPINFFTDSWPIDSDLSPTFLWNASLPDEYYSGEPILFQLQIQYRSTDFTSPLHDTGTFAAVSTGGGNWSYEIPYVLPIEGIYYARIRSRNSLMWSAWSSTLRWEFGKSVPPPPTIDPVTSPTMEFTQLITGGKAPDAHVFIRDNNGAWHEVTYTYGIHGGRWSYLMTLTAGGNSIEAIADWDTDLSSGTSLPAYAFILVVYYEVEPYNIWNCFDELGLLVSLPRILGEKNKPYKKRILDVFIHPGNSTHDGLVNAIARELSIPPSSVAVYRLSDLADPAYAGNLFNSDHNAIGTKLEDYAKEVYDHNPIFWGNLICDESVWDAIDEEYTGYSYLPHLWDPTASGIYPKWQKLGIGDQDDLWVNDVVTVTDHKMSLYPLGVAWDVEHWRLPIHSGYFYAQDLNPTYFM